MSSNRTLGFLVIVALSLASVGLGQINTRSNKTLNARRRQRAEDDLTLDGSAKQEIAPKEVRAPEQAAIPSRVRRPQVAARAKLEAIQLDRRSGESLGDAWDRYFAAQADKLDNAKDREALLQQSEAAVRQTVRDLMQAKDYAGTTALINSALRAGQGQTWMYEALSLAMRAANAPEEDIERALMSGVDLSDDLDSVMLIALYMSKAGLEKSALHLYQQVAAAQPSRPEPYVQGLACAKYLHDRDGIMWACKGILSQAWERERRHIEREAVNQARAMILELEKDNQAELAKKFEADLQQAMARDCLVVVSWTGDADLDVSMEEPSGTICSLEKPRSAGGGVLLGDSFAQGASNPGGFQEVYACPQAFSGEYRMLIKRIWGKVTAGKVTVEIYTKYQTKDQKRFRQQIELGEKNAVVVFNLDEGRRKDLLAEEQIANVAKIQNAVGRQVLAQQIGQFQDSSASARYLASLAQSQGVDPRFLLAGLGRRGAVGFTIRPTILPEGLRMTSQAVISADRRYVRVTPTPMINSIGQVTTFNVAGGATNNVTNNAGGGGGGNFGGVGGGGMGGLGGFGS
jgi:hypothetical protein